MEKGLLFVVSAPAGCGKDTILEQLFKCTENVGYSVSATSRAPREGEVDGVHYHFRTREQFEQRTHKRLIDIIAPTQKTVDALSRLEMPAGVHIDIKMKAK